MASIALIMTNLIIGTVAVAAGLNGRSRLELFALGLTTLALTALALGSRLPYRERILFAGGLACGAAAFSLFSFERWPGWFVCGLLVAMIVFRPRPPKSY